MRTAQPRLREIDAAAEAFYGVDLHEYTATPYAVSARAGAYQAARYVGYSLPEIGRHFGRDHTTVLHACKKPVPDDDLLAILDAARFLAARRLEEFRELAARNAR